MSNAFTRNAQSKTVGSNFLMQMAPALDRQVSVQVEWLESTEEITARDFESFRARALALYQSSARGMNLEYDRRCRFGHPAIDAVGFWVGPCVDGAAQGNGFGLTVDAGGNTVEYVGQASGGVAEGIGAMVFRSPGLEGAVYYEGRFAAGQPDGAVRVEQAGRKPRIRNFVAGVDKGVGDVGQWQAVKF
jgi:hypothetical protein